MSDVHVDSQALRDFATKLSRFSQLLGEEMVATQGAIGRLSDSWKDAEFENFRQAFAKTQPTIKRLIEETGRAVPKLQRDADAIDEFIRLKP